MAKIVEETLKVKFSRLVRDDADDVGGMVTDEHVTLIDAALQEVLELPDGVVVEVTPDE